MNFLKFISCIYEPTIKSIYFEKKSAMKRKSYVHLLVVAFVVLTANAQEQENAKSIRTANTMYTVPSLSSRMNNLVLANGSPKEAGDKRTLMPQVIPGKDPQMQDDYYVLNRHEMEQTRAAMPVSLVFDAVTEDTFPTDPSIAVGPDHVIVVFNLGFRIFDKQGNPLTGQLDVGNIFTNDTACCDPTISYDNAADRWVMSLLYDDLWGSNFDGIQVAVSDGPNPLNANWNNYQFNMDTHAQKLSVWSDGYYITSNSEENELIHALERDVMLAGGAAPQIIGFNLPGAVINGFLNPQALNVTDDNLPAPGGATFLMMQDDTYAGINSDHIKVWTVDVDWNTPSNATITSEPQIELEPFISVFDGGGFDNLVQPNGAAINALYGTIQNQAQFRKFDTHNAAVFNFTVDADAGSGKLAAVRWVELRQAGDNLPWSLYQEGTYTAADGKHAWCASIAMDGAGNIGLGYSAMSGPTSQETIHASSYYSGRLAGDPLGTMSMEEGLIANGTADFPNNRYGDYSKMDVDPADDLTFWFDTEYMNPERKNVVGAFKIDDALGTNDMVKDQTELIVISTDNNQFEISLITSFNKRASIAIYNLHGQQLAFNFIEKQGDRFNYTLDMSYATTGIYLVKMGDPNSESYTTAKILVH